jgi:hypothetical protein
MILRGSFWVPSRTDQHDYRTEDLLPRSQKERCTSQGRHSPSSAFFFFKAFERRLRAPGGLQSEDQINPVVSRAKRRTWKRAGSATSNEAGNCTLPTKLLFLLN